MDTVTEKPRQAATLYSWNTSAEQISVRLNGEYLEVRIGDLNLVLSAAQGEKAIGLAEKLAVVEITETVTSKIRV